MYKIDHIKMTTPCNRRPGTYMQPEYITIHNTGNPKSTAANERSWLTNPSNNVTASYHIVIDERETIECLPLNEVGWHAGDGKNGTGNRKSIGIEICESGNYAKTLERAVELVARLLKERGWGVDRLRRHYDWSGKNCPRLMNADEKWTGWADFKTRVAAKLQPAVVPVSDQVTIVVNGNLLDQKGTLKNGVTTVPVRGVAEALGASVKWDGESRTVYINN
ncbi:N-acetylmuramoyl-L-alanine amidase [Paenibacillus sp. 1011MAR3C5]|uniref:N-acetylmuramoyl-L-alanine amidase n=1 Tax=Paenibacillus sp. 1011MAR3C5 TaxID=1675787 RepID=UPI000E6C8453|nr:N-acetylmuramoyl-L-alanine amidase [Paenibacillus sp. 1011MAR3C5]RJE88638.1 N-acetylmuramoyl-L-alanine amidase [Paenibacillus sp. 1011MAR3C5]